MKNTLVPVKKPFQGRSSRLIAAVAVSVFVLGGTLTQIARADQYDAQIQALQSQNAQAEGNVDSLTSQANSYQDAINKLQTQIDAVQAQLAANTAEQAQLQQEITEKQAEIDKERALLADDIKAMYVDGNMSTVEMLATSKNLSEYVDKQEYRNLVQQNIQDAMAKITALQNELKQKKTEVDQLVADQQTQNAQLAAARQQQSDMLAYTTAQRDAFSAQISANSSKIAELRRQQIIANSAGTIGAPGVGVNCGGGYPGATTNHAGQPWGCNYPQDNYSDNWGMLNRECVSYTAFKVHMDFLAGRDQHDMPWWGGSGNANQWPANARAAGITVDDNPTPGSIAIKTAGYYGHAMYVEQVGTVNGSQAVYVSQYNQQLTGQYSEQWRYTDGLVFLHF